MKCSICNLGDIQKVEVNELVSVPYGPINSFVTIQSVCDMCGEACSLTRENEKIVNDTLQECNKQAVINMLAFLIDKGITLRYFERTLHLPVGSVEKWKSGYFSASDLVLLRLIRTYPWLLEVADLGFEQIEKMNRER